MKPKKTPGQVRVSESTYKVAPKDKPHQATMTQEIDHCYHEIDCSDFMSFANVSTLARPLEDYRNSQALVTIVLHALTGKPSL